jgi:peptidoglycan/LPS O-acetylase OafA/YrhL
MGVTGILQDREVKSQKLTGLELLRFASALAVLIWHYQHFWYVADMPVDFIREKQPLYGLLWPLYNYGVYGVQVFWIISGYIFFWKYAAGIADGRVSGWKFLVLRFSRLYPLHLATLVAVVVLQWKFQALSGQPFVYPNNDGFHLMLQLGLASNWGWEVGPSFNGPIWSISLEVVVYGLFFGVMRLVGSGRWVAPGMLLLGALGYLLKIPSQIFQCVFCFFLGGFVAQTGGGLAAQTGGGLVAEVASSVRAVGLLRVRMADLQTAPALVCGGVFRHADSLVG